MLSLSNVPRVKARELLGTHAFHYTPCLLLDVILSAGPVLRRKTDPAQDLCISKSHGHFLYRFGWGTALAVPPNFRLPISLSERLAREEFRRLRFPSSHPREAQASAHTRRGTGTGLNGTLRCHPEEAQAFVHESLPTKDLCIMCRTPIRHRLLLALAVTLSAGPVYEAKQNSAKDLCIAKSHAQFSTGLGRAQL
jgi:hypothetical protein